MAPHVSRLALPQPPTLEHRHGSVQAVYLTALLVHTWEQVVHHVALLTFLFSINAILIAPTPTTRTQRPSNARFATKTASNVPDHQTQNVHHAPLVCFPREQHAADHVTRSGSITDFQTGPAKTATPRAIRAVQVQVMIAPHVQTLTF